MRPIACMFQSLVPLLPAIAMAQGFQTGQRVYATPSGAWNDWYAGCVVHEGRSNRSYQVECRGTAYWIDAANISTTTPQPKPDPMRPGQMLIPTVTASTVPQPASKITAQTPTATTVAVAPQRNDTTSGMGEGPGNYAAGMARRIAADKAAAESAVLRSGKYSCYSMGQYTFTDLYITGAHTYSVKPGGSGSFNYDKGTLTFQSGPYAGAYSRMVDGKTIGVSAKGNTNLGTQCGFDG